MGGAILESTNSASLATAVLVPDIAAKLVRQQSVSLCSAAQHTAAVQQLQLLK